MSSYHNEDSYDYIDDFEVGDQPRGCGDARISGAIYAEIPLADWGVPIDTYFICPPQPLSLFPDLGVTPQGVTMIERNGVHHVVDWVGANFYPNVSDFVREAKRLGFSRRLPKTLDFAKLTRDSRIIFIHSRASMRDPRPVLIRWMASDHQRTPLFPCPKSVSTHVGPDHADPEMCCGFYDYDLVDGTPAPGRDDPDRVIREMPSFSYGGWAAIPGVGHEPAMFMSAPIIRLGVVNGEGADEAFREAAAAAVPVRRWDR